MKKYYFITYQGLAHGSDFPTIWNAVINISPMQFIRECIEQDNTYQDFALLFAMEITKVEFTKFKGEF